MDILTHAISGAVLAYALPSKRLTGKQVGLLAALSIMPDIDIILRFFSDTLYLSYHRGITHSLLMLPLWSWLLWRILRRHQQDGLAMPWWLIAAAIALHISFDLVTAFGTMVLAPFSSWRATLDLLFIIDPLFTLLLLLPLLLAFVWQQQARRLATASLLCVAGYLILCAVMHQKALTRVAQVWPQAQLRAALPIPVSPFRWWLLARVGTDYRVAGIDFFPQFHGSASFLPQSLLDMVQQELPLPGAEKWQRWQAMDAVLTPAQQQLPGIVFYRWFARFPVLIRSDSDGSEFGDLRFVMRGGFKRTPYRLQLRQTSRPETWMVTLGGKAFVIE